jgi:hypothetical protein
VRDVSQKKNLVVEDHNPFKGFENLNEPRIEALSNGTVAIVPDQFNAKLYETSTAKSFEIEKPTHFDVHSTKFFVRDGKAWFAAVKRYDYLKREGGLIVAPVKGQREKRIAIPMKDSNQQLTGVEVVPAGDHNYYVMTEVSDREFSRILIYDESDGQMTNLKIPMKLPAPDFIYSESKILPDGRWVALFTNYEGRHPQFVQLKGPADQVHQL